MQSKLSIKRILCASALLVANVVATDLATAALPPKLTKENFAKFPIDGKQHTYKVTLQSTYQHPNGSAIHRDINDITVVVPEILPGTGPTNSSVNLLQYGDELILSSSLPPSDLCFEIHTDTTDYIAKTEKNTRHVVTIVTVDFEPTPNDVCARRAEQEGFPIPESHTDECGVAPDLACLMENARRRSSIRK